MRATAKALIAAIVAGTIAACSSSSGNPDGFDEGGTDATSTTSTTTGTTTATTTGTTTTGTTTTATTTGTTTTATTTGTTTTGTTTGTMDSGTTVNCSGAAPTGGTKECSSNASGTVNGETWTIWSSGTGGCMTPYNVGAAFNATWDNSGDFLAREGLQWNSTQTYSELGTIMATFAETKTGSAGGYSYIGIYGWSENPLHEYYIVEDWFGAGPPNPGGTLEGTITVDGGTYNVYTHTQTNQPAITGGNATFVQFFSVRQTARQCGTISISEHFSKWATMGMTLGNMEEAKLLLEAGGGIGSIAFSTGTVTAN